MILPLADQTREREQSPYGEAVRLSNEVRPVIAHTDIETGLWIEARQGINIETDGYPRFMVLLSSGKLNNHSLTCFILRIMAWRFPNKYNEIKSKLNRADKIEFDLIISNIRYEFEWLGETGYQNKVRYDKTLNKHNIISIKTRNGNFITKRKFN
tara:strand:+ start:277 stop:741 length:465 start_codon:yes stop_codon:yes gene_type:complete